MKKEVKCNKIVKFNVEKVDNFLKENHLTKGAFCKLLDITPYSLRLFYKNDYALYLSVLRKMCDFMNVEIMDLIEEIN